MVYFLLNYILSVLNTTVVLVCGSCKIPFSSLLNSMHQLYKRKSLGSGMLVLFL